MDERVVELLGTRRAGKLRRFAEQTGLTAEALLQRAFDLLECNLQYMPKPKKHPDAIALGKARWANVSDEEKSAANRHAAQARWSKVRAEKAAKTKKDDGD